MTVQQPQHYLIGSRVRLTCHCAGSQVGEEARIIEVKRDAQGNVVALDILFDTLPETTRGTTVYPREIEVIDE